MPKVSVIIPTYNQASLLPEAIDSALEQSLTDLEVIVVDDGSTDKTTTVVRNYEDDRIRFIRHKKNRGGNVARNTGIDAASGQYIAFLDSDDKFHEQKLEIQINTLESRGDEWIAVYCDIEREGDQVTNPLRRKLSRIIQMVSPSKTDKHPVEGGEELLAEIFTTRFSLGGASTLLVTQDAVKVLDGFDEQFERHQDLEFLIRLLKHGKLAYIEETLISKTETGLAPVDDVKRAKERLFRKFQADINKLEAQGEPVRAVHNFHVCRRFFRSGQFVDGFRYLAQSQPLRRRQYAGLLFDFYAGALERTYN